MPQMADRQSRCKLNADPFRDPMAIPAKPTAAFRFAQAVRRAMLCTISGHNVGKAKP
jgi:hypothetical protein